VQEASHATGQKASAGECPMIGCCGSEILLCGLRTSPPSIQSFPMRLSSDCNHATYLGFPWRTDTDDEA
jgi:hypothetical protein